MKEQQTSLKSSSNVDILTPKLLNLLKKKQISKDITYPKLNKYIPVNPTEKQQAFLSLNCIDALYGGAAGGGKVLGNDSNILTPFGFRKGKEIKVGDLVNNPDGSVSKIIKVHPEMEYDEWVIKFHDGTQTTVTGGHLWLAWRSGVRKKYKGKSIFGEKAAQIVETRQIKDWLDHAKEQKDQNKRPNWPCIPVCQEQSFNVTYKYRSKINAYILGCLVGKGLITQSVKFFSYDADFYMQLFDYLKYSYSYNGKYLFRLIDKTGEFYRKDLKRLKLFEKKEDKKFIPKEFLFSDKETRYAVLQGLLDSKGEVSREGKIFFYTLSKRLSKDVAFLVRSLGGTATIFLKSRSFWRNAKGKKILSKKMYYIYIKHREGEKLFQIPLKKYWAAKRRDPIMYKRVTEIDIKEKKFKGRCITVSHPNGLYITDDFIVTHNSEAILMAALQYVETPKYNAIILRNTYANLSKPDGLIDRSSDWLNNTDAEWRETKKRWEFPSGATLSFGYLEGPRDHFNYQGPAYQFVGIDEIVQIRENQALYLFSRLRRLKNSDIPIRFRSTSNPPAREQITTGGWVKKRYIDPETRKNRIFISAKMDDNKHLDVEEYRRAFVESGIDPITRRQLEDGDWEIQAKGKMFQREWFGILDKAPIKYIKAVRYWDMAATEEDPDQDENKGPAYTAGCKMIKLLDGTYCIVSMIRKRLSPLQAESLIRQTADMDGIDVTIYMEQEPGASGKTTIDHYRRNVLPGFVFYADPAIKKKEMRWGPFASQAEAGNIFLLRNEYWNEKFLNEAELVPYGYKDQIDASSGAFLKLAGVGVRVAPKLKTFAGKSKQKFGVLKKRWNI